LTVSGLTVSRDDRNPKLYNDASFGPNSMQQLIQEKQTNKQLMEEIQRQLLEELYKLKQLKQVSEDL